MRLAHATRLVVYSFAITLLHPASPFTNTVVHPISGVVNKRSKRVILHDKRTYHDCSHDRSRGHSSSTWEDGVQSHTTYDRRLSIGVISRRSVSVNLFACLGDDESLEDDELWPRPVRGNARVADDREVTDETVVNEQLACTSSDDDDLCDGEQDTNSRTLDQVVARLRGEIQAGTIPQIKSRVALDGLFAELRNRPPPKSSGTTLNVGSAAGAAGADGPRSESSNRAGRTPTPLALNGATTNRRQHQQGKKTNNTSADARKASGTVVSTSDEPGTLPGNSYSGDGEDLESLADMLSRLQANAQARDLAEADARAAVLRSGGPVGESFSTLIASKHTDMRTRFASIREGRVSWAVLPLILRAREARIPLSTGVYNAAISAYMSQPHKYSDALKVLDLLRNSDEPDVKPDVHSYNCAARVCGEAGKWRVVFQVFATLKIASRAWSHPVHDLNMFNNCSVLDTETTGCFFCSTERCQVVVRAYAVIGVSWPARKHARKSRRAYAEVDELHFDDKYRCSSMHQSTRENLADATVTCVHRRQRNRRVFTSRAPMNFTCD